MTHAPARQAFRVLVCLLALLGLLRPVPVLASAGRDTTEPATQAPPPPPRPPLPPGPPPPELVKVFLDCTDSYCDENFVRSEITFVSWVRDRKDAEVHLMMTSQSTGGGGTEFDISFIGHGRFEQVNQHLIYVSPTTDSSDKRRRGMVRTFKMGLVRYAAESPAALDLDVTHQKAKGPQGASKGARDPWNSWVFRTGVNAYGSGEQSQTSLQFGGNVSANRVTERWKLTNSIYGSYSTSRYTFSEGDTYTSTQRSFSASSLIVKSLGAHWGGGGRVTLASSTYSNSRLSPRFAPSFEYNLFPYAESTKRQLTLNYGVGYTLARYREETIFGKMREGLFDHFLTVGLVLKQPWGTTSTSVSASQYLHDRSKNSVNVYNSTDLRLVKGLSLSVYGSVSRVHDQLHLPMGEATQEEVLVRQRQLATSYRYYFSIGFSYSFGSIFNNVVNSRFENSGGGTVIYYY